MTFSRLYIKVTVIYYGSVIGYLIDDPNPVEYSSDEEESASDNASENDEEHKNENVTEGSSEEEDNLQALISELDGLNEDNEEPVDMWLPRSARKKHRKNGKIDENAAQTSLTEQLLNDDDEEDQSEDEDWQPGKKRKTTKNKTSSEIKDVKRVKESDDENEHKIPISSSKHKKKMGRIKN